MTDTAFPAGWYDDGSGGQRWWDGQQWTETTRPAPAPAATDADDVAGARPRRRQPWVAVLLIAAVVAVAAAAGAWFWLAAPSPEPVVKANRAAVVAQNCAAFRKTVTTSGFHSLFEHTGLPNLAGQPRCRFFRSWARDQDEKTINILSSDTSGSRAVVDTKGRVVETSPHHLRFPVWCRYSLTRSSRTWKINSWKCYLDAAHKHPGGL